MLQSRVSSWLGLPEAALSRGPWPPEPAPRRHACSPPQASWLPASAAHRTQPGKPPPRSAAAPPRRAAPQARPPPGGRRSGASAPRGPPRQNKGMREGPGRRAGHREARPVAAQGELLGSNRCPRGASWVEVSACHCQARARSLGSARGARTHDERWRCKVPPAPASTGLGFPTQQAKWVRVCCWGAYSYCSVLENG